MGARVTTDDLGPVAGRVPPCDLDAEAVVLSAVMLEAHKLPLVSHLRPDHFYSIANRTLFETVLALEQAGLGVDMVSVSGYLRDHGKLSQVGGNAYLVQTIDSTPAVANIRQHADSIIAKWRLRQTIQIAQRIAGESYGQITDSELEHMVSSLSDVVRSDPARSPWGEAVTWESVLSNREPIRWLCEPLGLGPGLPCLVAGYGYSGKTVAVQSLALSVMCGKPIWGCFGLNRKGPVLHLDWEQGHNVTAKRYERMVRALDLEPSELEHLDVRSMPARYLTDPSVEDELVRMARGFELVIVDSFRAACPTIKEDDSEARRPIDMMRRVGTRVDCSVIVIHHARKAAEKETRAKSQAVRGTGALFDAPSSVFLLEGLPSNGKPSVNRSRVEHVKMRETGRTLEPFTLEIEDVGTFDAPTEGLTVTAIQEQPKTPEKEAREDVEQAKAKVLDVLQRGPQATRRSLAKLSGVRYQLALVALDLLVADGAVVEAGKHQTKTIKLAEQEEVTS